MSLVRLSENWPMKNCSMNSSNGTHQQRPVILLKRCSNTNDTCLLRGIGRLREIAFRAAEEGTNIPTLYKQYTELCEAGGVTFLDFGVDKEFSDCIDGLVMVDIQQLKPKKRARYIDIHQTNDNETTKEQI